MHYKSTAGANIKTLSFVLLFCGILLAQTIDIGTNISILHIRDQFGKELPTTKSKKLIFAFSKEKVKEVKNFLEKNPKYLKNHQAHFIADISPAPSFIANIFMIPKFKKYPFKMGLIREEKRSSMLPKRVNLLTILSLKKSEVTKIEFQEILP